MEIQYIYVNELGSPNSNPGGKLSEYDCISSSFKKSELLKLPVSINARKIFEFEGEKIYIYTNDDYIFNLN